MPRASMPEAMEDSDTEAELPPIRSGEKVGPLSMSDAKKGLALTFGVAPEAIEITIRGQIILPAKRPRFRGAASPSQPVSQRSPV